MTSEVRIYQRTAELTNSVAGGIFPHSDELPPRCSRRVPVPKELRVEVVDAGTSLAEGDVLLVNEPNRIRDHFDYMTAREAITSDATSLVVVQSATAKTVTVVYLKPLRWSLDLGDLASQTYGDPFRISRTAGKREIGRLGTLGDMQERLTAHPQFHEWKTAYAALVKQRDADAREFNARQERLLAAAKPYQEAAERLSAALGAHRAVWVSVFGDAIHTYFQSNWEWITVGDRGEVHLHGLVALGRLDGAALRQALEDLQLMRRSR